MQFFFFFKHNPLYIDKMREGLIDNWAEGATQKDQRNNLLQDNLSRIGKFLTGKCAIAFTLLHEVILTDL